MKSALIVLALAAAAGADYIDIRGFTASETCDGHAVFVTNGACHADFCPFVLLAVPIFSLSLRGLPIVFRRLLPQRAHM